MKGMNFADWAPYDRMKPPQYGPLYNPIQADGVLTEVADLGANWITLVLSVFQENVASNEVIRAQNSTASDSALRHMIELAHSMGMRVMLKPNIQFSQDPEHGHIQLGTAFTTEEQWQAWFSSYRQITNYYATLAYNAGADMFCIGDELMNTSHREVDWRRIAWEVRRNYKGSIIYESTTVFTLNENPSASEELRIKWWDAVDYIGVLGYYPLTPGKNPSIEELKSAWVDRGYISRLEALSQKF